VTERPSDNGVPLRVVVALGLAASFLARCLAPALPGLMVGIESAIVWTGRAASLLTLLAATGLVAGLARLATIIITAPSAPLVARLVAVPSVALGCLLLLLASFRPLEPRFALTLGITAAIVGALSARHNLAARDKRAAALVLGLTSFAGLTHVLSRKLTQDASDAANIAAFRTAQLIETLGSLLDLVALALTFVWLQRRTPRGRVLVPVVLALSGICVVLALRGSAPGASTLSVFLSRALEKLARDQSSLFPQALGHMLNVGALLAAVAALFGKGGDLGVVLAACLAARAALDIPIPALMLELAALYLPFVRPAPSTPAPKPSAPVIATGDPAPP
jgi:hypothetical protein